MQVTNWGQPANPFNRVKPKLRNCTQRILFGTLLFKSNLDCNYHFLIDLAQIGIPITVKSIKPIQSKFGFD